MADLIQDSRAFEIPALASANPNAVQSIISACSQVIENHCNRKFALGTYDEVYNGTGTKSIYLHNTPIVQVNYVRSGLFNLMQVQNNTQGLQSALVQVNPADITCSTTVNNATTSNVLSYASYPTVATMSAAINALGNGWSANFPPLYSGWASSDLAFVPGSFSARNLSVLLFAHWWYEPSYRFNSATGEVWCGGGWPRDWGSIRVSYKAGYTTIPEPIQQACAELVQMTYLAGLSNPVMASETIGTYSYTRLAQLSFANLSAASKHAISFYKTYRVGYWGRP